MQHRITRRHIPARHIPRRRFDQRTDRVPLIIGAALRHYMGAERTALLDLAASIQYLEVYS